MGKDVLVDLIASSLGVGIGQHKQRWDYFAQAVALREAWVKDSSGRGSGESGPSAPVRLRLPPSELDRDGNGILSSSDSGDISTAGKKLEETPRVDYLSHCRDAQHHPGCCFKGLYKLVGLG